MAGVVSMEARVKDQQNPAKLAYKGAPSVHNGLLRKTTSVRGKSGAPVARGNADLLGGKGPAREATKEEKLALKETEDEFKRRNFFKRIFPSGDFLYYKRFFEEERPLNNFLDAKLMAQFRDNNPQARMQYEKMPRFLLQSQSSTVKQNMAPVSGSTSIRHQTEILIESYRNEKPAINVAHSYNQVFERTKAFSQQQSDKVHRDIVSMSSTDPYQLRSSDS